MMVERVSTGRSDLLSIVTATFNCVDTLPELISSLRCQSDTRFEWIVADGGSTDGTLELLRAVESIPIVLSVQNDFGIYDALNRAIKLCAGSHYVVAGSDDVFFGDAVGRFLAEIGVDAPDLVTARVTCDGRELRVRRAPSWMVAEKAYVAHHCVGTAIKKELHARFGYYTPKLPIAADALFLLRACQRGVSVRTVDCVVGKVGSAGISATDWAGSATELFRVQLLCGRLLSVQIVLLLMRLLKGSVRIIKDLHDAVFR